MRAHVFFLSLLVPLAGCTSTAGSGDVDLHMQRDFTPLFPDHCSDASKNEDETDVDCGGDTCPKCAAGKFCLHASDCASTICDNNACASSSCSDHIKNGTETDVDCGGDCPGCPVGKPCLLSKDCASGNCVNNVCQAGQCMDQTKNGMETDVDCGGGTCPTCDAGKACLLAADCTSGKCVNNVCISPIMCMAGTADCDGNAQNGCEVNTSTDAKNCGSCGKVCPMNMPTCSGGKCQGGPKVLLVHSEGMRAPMTISDLQKKLIATGAFGAVDAFDAGVQTPTVKDLTPYDAVLAFAYNAFQDANTLGDNLALYWDSGGRVVLAARSTGVSSSSGVNGAFAGYQLCTGGNSVGLGMQSMQIDDPNSPLMAGVAKVQVPSISQAQGCTQKNNFTVVAHWTNTIFMVARGSVKGRNRVDVNFYPISADADAGYGWTGDGAIIMRNALLFR